MDKIGFRLNKINTLQFAVIEEAYDFKIDDFNLETNLGFGVDFENKAILSLVKVQFEQKEAPFIILEVSCEFDVEPKFWKEFEKEETIRVPNHLMCHLAMITVGTARGVLHAKLENSKFNDFILPTINVDKMIKEDGSFKK